MSSSRTATASLARAREAWGLVCEPPLLSLSLSTRMDSKEVALALYISSMIGRLQDRFASIKVEIELVSKRAIASVDLKLGGCVPSGW